MFVAAARRRLTIACCSIAPRALEESQGRISFGQPAVTSRVEPRLFGHGSDAHDVGRQRARPAMHGSPMVAMPPVALAGAESFTPHSRGARGRSGAAAHSQEQRPAH